MGASADAWLPGTYEVQIFVGTEWIKDASGTFIVTGKPPTAAPTISPTPTPPPAHHWPIANPHHHANADSHHYANHHTHADDHAYADHNAHADHYLDAHNHPHRASHRHALADVDQRPPTINNSC